MTRSFKPDGYSTVSPYLVAAGAQAVIDVDATYARAVESGGVPVQALQRKGEDPDRRGGVKDPAGNTCWIATQVA